MRLADYQPHRTDALHGVVWREAEDISSLCREHSVATIYERMLLGAQVANVWYVQREWFLDHQRVGSNAEDAHSHRVGNITLAVAHCDGYITTCETIAIVVVKLLADVPSVVWGVVHNDATLWRVTRHSKHHSHRCYYVVNLTHCCHLS